MIGCFWLTRRSSQFLSVISNKIRFKLSELKVNSLIVVSLNVTLFPDLLKLHTEILGKEVGIHLDHSSIIRDSDG